MRDGKFHFTQPEMEYFCQYAQFLLNEDPTMSTTVLLQAIHKKVRGGLRYLYSICSARTDFAIRCRCLIIRLGPGRYKRLRN
jgi:hypothetical protein